MTLDKDGRQERSAKPLRQRTYREVTPTASSSTLVRLDARDLLWQRLQGRQLGGFRFHRALKIPPHVVDFACLGRKLVVEVVEDATRDEAVVRSLGAAGYRVMQLREQDVLARTEAVLQAILKALAEQRRR